MRVLVVDDEALIRWSVCAALEAAGFDAVSAVTADDALALAAEWPPPKVALLDIQPDGQGRMLMDGLRRIYPDCRFLIMSTTRRGAPGSEATGVQTVEKPFDMSELVRMVDHAVRQDASL